MRAHRRHLDLTVAVPIPTPAPKDLPAVLSPDGELFFRQGHRVLEVINIQLLPLQKNG